MKNPCYACDSNLFEIILINDTAMSSDGQIVDLEIKKEECKNCGTIRTENVSFLDNFYENYYQLNTSNLDPTYVFDKEEKPKSEMHFEWINLLVANKIKSAESIIEIGCGSGNLLKLFDIKNKFGVEPSKIAAQHASKIANTRTIGYEDISNIEVYDVILSTCVIEHTINPNDFLKKIWNISSENSTIIIGLPIQNAESFDLYFLDHLHHFTLNQFIMLCNKNGLNILNYEIGYKCISTIGYFILEKKQVNRKKIIFEKNINLSICQNWINNLNTFLNNNKNQSIFSFGFGETSFFFQTYSNLKHHTKYFIDDVKANTLNTVISSTKAKNDGILENGYLILLTNPSYHQFLIQKFKEVINLKFYSPFSNKFIEIDNEMD